MHKPFVQLAAAVALSLLLLNGGAVAAGTNVTRVADTLGDGEEFLMESETSRRILQGKPPTITYPPLTGNGAPCNGDIYGSCNGRPGKIGSDRNCGYMNNCCRGCPK